MKKVTLGLIGLIIVVGVASGGLASELQDWSTVGKTGANIFNIAAVVLGLYLIYWGLKKK